LANPILFVGVTNSAANSYDSVRQTYLALKNEDGEIPHGILKHNAFGITSMAFPSKCSNFIYRDYLFNGELPTNNIQCEADQPLFSGI
jgi:hypothetical protein